MKALFFTILLSYSALSNADYIFPIDANAIHQRAVDDLALGKLNSADRGFSMAHQAYLKWADENSVDLYETYFYKENLDHWLGIKMISNPAAAVLLFEELEAFDLEYSTDLLAFRVVSSLDPEFENENLKSYERRSEHVKKAVKSSRVLHSILYDSAYLVDVKTVKNSISLEKSDRFKLIKNLLNLIELYSESNDLESELLEIHIVDSIEKKLKQRPLISLRTPVLEALICLKVSEAFGLERFKAKIDEKIVDVYFNVHD